MDQNYKIFLASHDEVTATQNTGRGKFYFYYQA